MNPRIKNTLLKLKEQNSDSLLLSCPSNISYLTKFISRDSLLLLSNKGNFYFTDSRYAEEVKNKLKGVAGLRKIDGPVFDQVYRICLDLKIRRLGFEANNLSFAEYKKMYETLGKKIGVLPTYGMIEQLREIKDVEEIREIRKAINITKKALKFAGSFISAGRKEIEIVAELERFIRYNGASDSSFDIIVASGPNSAFPHHMSSERKLRNNEIVLIDIGINYKGYNSDLTRIFFLGKINACAKQVYEIVANAQKRAIDRIRPGVKASEVDSAARQYITEKGLGGFFGHTLGHGVGLDIHEYPRISAKETKNLQAGMVFTVEPAVYLPSKFGIRIEDMVLVTKKGCEVLSGVIN